jgi:hypothetical protein
MRPGMTKTDEIKNAVRAISLLVAIGAVLFWAVCICVGVFEPKISLGERVEFIVFAPVCFVLGALWFVPQFLWMAVSPIFSGEQGRLTTQQPYWLLLCRNHSIIAFWCEVYSFYKVRRTSDPPGDEQRPVGG